MKFKKIVTVITMALFAYSLTGCQLIEPENNKNDKISVVTTIFPQYDFVRQIAGDNADVTMLLSPGSDSHSYEPTPQDIINIQECDLFIYVGGEGDVWVDNILESMSEPVNTITLMDCVDTVEEEIVEGMESDDEEESEEPELDEHVWTSPKNAIKIVNAISNKICSIDEQNKDLYKQNTDNYIKDLETLDQKFEDIVENSKRKTIVFGDRFPFRYFADAYGLQYFAAFPGCSSDSEPSASTMAFLIDKVNAENIPVIFKIEFSNGKIAKTIAEASNAEILEFHSCHNVTTDELKNDVSYISLMTKNAEVLEKALN